jgi:phytoene synthase
VIGGLIPETVAPRVEVSPDELVRSELGRVAAELGARGLPVPTLDGKLLRPSFALAMVPASSRPALDDRFWSGALAIQMAHEASLLHDDVIDGATERRGRPTLAASRGSAAALVAGDHILTAAYRAAVATGSFEFVARFSEAVERTVAGEIAQHAGAGRVLSLAEYDSVVTGKSGELFGIAAILGGSVARLDQIELRHCLGCSFGNLYQRIDDLLDYCPGSDTGKPPFQDYRQGKWSWVLELSGIDGFGYDEDDVVHAIFARRTGRPSPARRALEILRDRQRLLLHHAPRVGADSDVLGALLSQCVGAAERGVAAQEAALAEARVVRTPVSHDPFDPGPREDVDPAALEAVRQQAEALGGPREWARYFGEHARTFRLAARLFPPREAGLVAGLYAYCRFTDDLVDDPADAPTVDELTRRLDAWRHLSLTAFDGTPTGVPLLDRVMADAAERGVARHYPEALLDGVAMDLEPRTWETWEELERYTFGVAGAVGGWMTQLFGCSDPELLEQAHALGHGMQLTNIARDVGEDLERGRLYLPGSLLDGYGLTAELLDAMASEEMPVTEEYRAAMGELLDRADRYYDTAWPGIRVLPPFFRRPVAAAASAYRGIHREIRRNGYDNLTRRAHTSTPRKIRLAWAGLVDAERAS